MGGHRWREALPAAQSLDGHPEPIAPGHTDAAHGSAQGPGALQAALGAQGVLRHRDEPGWPLPGSDSVLGAGEGAPRCAQAATGSWADSEPKECRRWGGAGALVQGWLPTWEGDVLTYPSGRWAN